MEAHYSRIRVVAAMLRKDASLLSRDFIFVFLTVLMLVTFTVLYWILPNKVNETISVGVHGTGMGAALSAFSQSSRQGLLIKQFDSSNSMRDAVRSHKLQAGIDFPSGFIAQTAAGRETTVTVFVPPTVTQEVRGALSSMVRELAYAVVGRPLPVKLPTESTVILGRDRAGNQVPLRDRLRPLYAFMVLIMEAVGLGGLIASEVGQRTLSAILVTPARVFDVLVAKIIVGTCVAFSEAVIILLLIRGFGPSPLIVLLALLLGAIMVTGVAMIAGSAGRDLVGTMFNGILMLIPIAIPAFAVLFPGTTATWVHFLPSYGLVKVIVGTSFEGAGWSESAVPLLILAGWCAVSILVGTLVLKRRARLV